MPVKVRKQIYLDPAQESMLKRIAGATGVSEAEIIRQAIDRHLQHVLPPRRDRRAWAAERAYLAELVALGPVAGSRSWRREDLYER
ncbi:MAG TPA: CopG family transcriptional regulator [Roseiflexaceae bacterium]|nr:CopG family transcriptional regulator [Roseiflexaceae bacterium]HMP42180.1 CopG family transcriptional regulator [Roseiflexaceae bacterium]